MWAAGDRGEMFAPLLLVSSFLGLGLTSDSISFCGAGWTFEKTCLGINFPTAYVDGKGSSQPAQCVIAIEDDGASSTQIENVCNTQVKDKKGVGAVPFDSKTATVQQLEKYFALKQTGFYYAADGKTVVPSSGKKASTVGYLCSITDEYVCQENWYRFGSYCYLPKNITATFQGALEDCEYMESATLPKITNDEENKFVAMLAREKIFKDVLGKNEIWGPLRYVRDDDFWEYAGTDTNDRKVLYMRWWSTDKGTFPVVQKPSGGFTASTIFTGRNDKDRTAYFGYWGTAKESDKKQYICRRPLEKFKPV